MSYTCVIYLSWFSGMDPERNPMPPGFPLVPPDVPEDPPAPADIPLEQPAAPDLFCVRTYSFGCIRPSRRILVTTADLF